ncbi:hypothetical protein ACIQU6_30590 [Streptomyces sp. NPDC090442]|uniref:hypothetical protein n=1 Tax=Streptomyces sp. NPDC090442 TaxID=3365962 RepID=UPI00381B90D8
MERSEIAAGLHRHQTDMHARQRRVLLLQRQLRAAEADRDQSVSALAAFGEQHEGARHEASRRAISRQLGVTHTTVNGMVDRAGRRPAAQAPQVVPVLSADKARAYVESGALGDITRITVAFNPADVLLESGLDPTAFADGTDIDAPNMLIHGTDGAVIGVEECLAGYGGTGPSNTHRLLTQLGWEDTLASQVFAHRFIELDRERVIRASEKGLHTVGGGLELAPGGGHFIVRLRSHRPYVPEGGSMYRTIAAWGNEVMGQPAKYPWAAGARRARVYLDRTAAASLQEPYYAWRGSSTFSVVIEQGRLQLWCSAVYPYNFADLLSTEQLRVLDAADLYPADTEPRSWLDKFLPRRRERPPYLTISDDGHDLTHDPEGAP